MHLASHLLFHCFSLLQSERKAEARVRSIAPVYIKLIVEHTHDHEGSLDSIASSILNDLRKRFMIGEELHYRSSSSKKPYVLPNLC